jgi:uncharacterized membrane protein YhaH (DUF805 family)
MKIKKLYTGRINRRQYLNGMLSVIVIAWIITSTVFFLVSGSMGETANVQAVTSFLIFPFTLGLVIKRLHDIGSSGRIYVVYYLLSFSFSLLFPSVAKDIFTLLNFGIGITILLTPGETTSNKYGEIPNKMSVKEIVFGKKESKTIITDSQLAKQEVKVEKSNPFYENAHKNKKIKNTAQLPLMSLAVLAIIAGLFYWFQYRPSKIKQECSWVEEISEAIPYRPAMNRGEMILHGVLEDCSKEAFANNPQWNSPEKIALEEKLCEAINETKVKEYSVAQEAVPAKSWWRKATTKEYEFCLHSRGL